MSKFWVITRYAEAVLEIRSRSIGIGGRTLITFGWRRRHWGKGMTWSLKRDHRRGAVVEPILVGKWTVFL